MAGSNLPNVGYDFTFKPEEIRRFMFVLYKKDDNTLNKVTHAGAVLKATWTALFDLPNFSDDTSGKVVVTPMCFGGGAVAGEPVAFDQNGYFRVLQDGSVDFEFTFYDIAPKLVGQMKDLQNFSIAAWPVTNDTRVMGIKDGADLKPIRIQNLTVPNYTPPTREAVATLTCKFRLETGSDMNNMVAVSMTDADVNDDSDFYSLRDVSVTVGTPATTGCTLVFTMDDVDPSAPGTTLYLTSSSVLHSSIKFADRAGGADISLAGAGSLTYDASTHTFTVNESALLTTQHTYDVKVTVSGFDIATGAVVVP